MWNAAHDGVKEFTVSASDLTDDMKLTRTLTGTSPDYGTVYVDENMNLIHAPAEADANDTLHLENCILSVETPGNEYGLNGNILSVVRHRLNGSVTAEAWVYTVAPEKLVEFEYNSAGLRVQKKVTDHGQVVTTDYIYHGKQLAGLTCGNDTLHFFYDAHGQAVSVNLNGLCYTYLHNFQGDVVGILDYENTFVVEYTYDVWGNPMTVRGVLMGVLSKINPFYYRGYVYDLEIAMYDLHSRYYDSEICRFISADNLVGVGCMLFSGNAYTYCKNSPVKSIDDDGKNPRGIMGPTRHMMLQSRLTNQLDLNSDRFPATFNPQRDVGVFVDQSFPFMEAREFNYNIGNEIAKKISDKMANDASDSTTILGILISILGAGIAGMKAGIAYAIGSGIIGHKLSETGSYFVAPQNYHVKVGLYDASTIEEGMVYVLVHVSADNDTAIYTGWDVYGTNIIDFSYEQVVRSALGLNRIDE